VVDAVGHARLISALEQLERVQQERRSIVVRLNNDAQRFEELTMLETEIMGALRIAARRHQA